MGTLGLRGARTAQRNGPEPERGVRRKAPSNRNASVSRYRHETDQLQVTEFAVLTSERGVGRCVLVVRSVGAQIEQLPDLQGYLGFASQREWRRIRMSLRVPF
jgi:hypothetical protein